MDANIDLDVTLLRAVNMCSRGDRGEQSKQIKMGAGDDLDPPGDAAPMWRDDVTSSSSAPAAGPPATQLDGSSDQLSWSIDNLTEIQAADKDIAPVLEWLTSGRTKPGVQELKPYNPATKAYCAQWNNLKLENGVVYRQYFREGEKVGHLQLFVPYQMQDQLMQEIHCNVTGHLDAQKTRVQVQRRVYWYGWARDVEIFCRACAPCNQYFRGAVPRHGRLQDMRMGAPLERLHVHLTGAFPRSQESGITYICTCVCHCKTCFLGPIRIHNQNGISIGSTVFAQLTAHCCQRCRGMAYPAKLPLPMWVSKPPPNMCFLGSTESAPQMASLTGQPFMHSSWQTVPIFYNGTEPQFSPKLLLPMGIWTAI